MIAPAGKVSEDGFTVLEMLVAFVILSVSMTVALQSVTLGTKGLSNADEVSAVLELLDELQSDQSRTFQTVDGQGATERTRQLRWTILAVQGTSQSRSGEDRGLSILRIYPITEPERHHDFLVFRQNKTE